MQPLDCGYFLPEVLSRHIAAPLMRVFALSINMAISRGIS
jgi:hypothetical protein